MVFYYVLPILSNDQSFDVDGYLAFLEADQVCDASAVATTLSADNLPPVPHSSAGWISTTAASKSNFDEEDDAKIVRRKREAVVLPESFIDGPTTTGAELALSIAASPICKVNSPRDVNITLTSEELEEVLEEIVSNLWVEKSSLSSSRRKKESTPDERVSSATMGVVSISFIATLLGLIVVSDFPKLSLDLKKGFFRC
ncbi:signal peptide, cub and egf-like domain-containing protein 1 [Plakobranchus ocellatus]|uniref:Signal peptide, cub and egf-like domain-containing protein 1 n=1 Tax=Plakobranchus ocellatus TaxID=259542 RepID=A0AAV4A6N3_9GAST|nr:signal peptide, cub and egf-like domain-containing protein 1 [Plakobranchus ocellatus]